MQFESLNDFRNRIADLDPGEEIDLTVVRDGRNRSISVTLGSREEDRESVSMEMEEQFGWQLSELTDELASRLGAEDVSGVVVVYIAPGSPAAMAGIQQGDIILEVNRTAVESLDRVREKLAGTVGEALLLIWRRGRTIYMVL